MNMSTHYFHRNDKRKQGFALIVTVSLLAFLVLLLVALATLTRVETQVAGNTQQVDQARQNALLALNVALGQLQKFTGPDQRVTTTSDIIADTDREGNPGPTVIPYAGVSRIPVIQRNWTGVWGNGATQIRYDRTPVQLVSDTSSPSNSRGISPQLLNWLVSGNEAVSFTTNTNGRGGVTASTTTSTMPQFSPNSPVSDLSGVTATTDSIKIRNRASEEKRAVLLVGANSAGPTPANYVVAPVVDLTAPPGTIPGLSASETATVGRYAWWVGDEGVKARVDLRPGYEQTLDINDQINGFITSQRGAIEFLNRDNTNGLTQFNSPIIATDDDTPLDTSSRRLADIVNFSQIPLLGKNTAAKEVLSSAGKRHFHDLTVVTNSVLSDVYAGGLKKDLTADIADTSPSGSNNPSCDRPANGDRIFTPQPGLQENLPTWGILRTWVRTNPDATGAVVPVPPEAGVAGIYPTLLYVSLGMNYYLDIDVDDDDTSKVLAVTPKMAFYPFVVLYNPYSVPIKASKYDLAIHFNSPAKMTVGIAEKDDAPFYVGATVKLDTAEIELKLATPPPPGTGGAVVKKNYFLLKIDGSTEDIPPGHRHTFVLSDAQMITDSNGDIVGREYFAGSPLLTKAENTATVGESNYFVLSSIDPITPVTFGRPIKTSSKIRLQVNYTSALDKNDPSLRFAHTSVTLAPEGKIVTDIWDAKMTDQYQALLRVFPHIPASLSLRGDTDESPPGFVNGQGYYCTTNLLGEKIQDRSIPPSGANSAFRMASVEEGHGWWSSNWKGGLIHGYTTRMIANGNIRAPFIMASGMENGNRKPDDPTTTDPTSPANTARPIGQRIGATVFGTVLASATADQGRDAHPGVGYTGSSIGFGESPDSHSTSPAVLWDILDSKDRLLSLGQLQHVPFSGYIFQTSYPFANSYADPRVARNATYRTGVIWRAATEFAFETASQTLSNPENPIYDLSWHLNRNIWDRYFVSGIPSTWSDDDIKSGKLLPNARMSIYRKDGVNPLLNNLKYSSGSNAAYDRAAANLMVEGGFNINSTSEQAWRAILAGTYKVPTNPQYAAIDDRVETAIPYPRFSRNLAYSGTIGVYGPRQFTMRPSGSGSTVSAANLRENLYYGNRGLFLNSPGITQNTSPEIVVNELARSIVNEIRRRGPFLSLADFINRPLTPPSPRNDANPLTAAGVKGALQAGIDNMNPNVAQVNPYYYPSTSGGVRSGQPGANSSGSPGRIYNLDDQHSVGGPVLSTDLETQAYRSAYAMAPKYLSQADLLTTLGPLLTARSDSFTIRTYGETVNPITGVIEGRAWCEAVVQRLPDYVDSTDVPEKPVILNGSANLSALNQAFGRKYKVVAFRWLSPQEI